MAFTTPNRSESINILGVSPNTFTTGISPGICTIDEQSYKLIQKKRKYNYTEENKQIYQNQNKEKKYKDTDKDYTDENQKEWRIFLKKCRHIRK
jgi:Rieske Fe-S protein